MDGVLASPRAATSPSTSSWMTFLDEGRARPEVRRELPALRHYRLHLQSSEQSRNLIAMSPTRDWRLLRRVSLPDPQAFPSRSSQPVALWGIGLYAQDEWRVNKSLKLTFALRASTTPTRSARPIAVPLLDGSFNTLLAKRCHLPVSSVQLFINADRTSSILRRRFHQLGSALRLCLVSGRQRQDGCPRRLRYLLRCPRCWRGGQLHVEPARLGYGV